MIKRLNEKVEENFEKGLDEFIEVCYENIKAPYAVFLRVDGELVLYVSLFRYYETGKKAPFDLNLSFRYGEDLDGFYNNGKIKYFKEYKFKPPKSKEDFEEKIKNEIENFMDEYKKEALEDIKKMKNKSTNESKKPFKEFKKSKLNENNNFSSEESKVSKLIQSFINENIHNYDEEDFEIYKDRFEDFMSSYKSLYNTKKTFMVDLLDTETKDLILALVSYDDGEEVVRYGAYPLSYIEEDGFSNDSRYGINDKSGFRFLSDLIEEIADRNGISKQEVKSSSTTGFVKSVNESKKQFKQFTSKAINEAELTELKDAIINREEFVDENVVGTSIGEDYIVSVFDKAVLIFTSDNTPFIIGREDLTEEEMDIVEELYSVLEISVDIDDEEGEEDYEEDEEIFVDDNTSDDLEMTEKSLKESSYPKANKWLKSVVKDLKDEFEISSSEVDKGVHGNDYAEEQGYDYLYTGKVTYKNEVSKDMLDEYKEWYEDVYSGRFDYDLNNKTIEFELGYGDDKDMTISMEKFMFESENNKKPNRIKKSLGESKKSKVKTLIKESGERVTTFKKGFDFKKYKSKA